MHGFGQRVEESGELTGVDMGGNEQLLTEGAAEFLDLPIQAPSRLGDDVADQGVAVGVDARGRQSDEHVTGTDLLGSEQLRGLDGTGGGTGDIVLIDSEQSRVFGGLPADECDSGRSTGVGDSAHDIGDAFGHDLAAGDVVGHEQGAGAADDDVVDDHAHEVVADGVVLIHGLRDGDLRAHPVGRRGEQRTFEVLEHGDVEESGESAHPTHDRGVVGGRDGGLHQFDGAVSGLDVDAGGGIGGGLRVRFGTQLSILCRRVCC